MNIDVFLIMLEFVGIYLKKKVEIRYMIKVKVSSLYLK